jgi:DNA-binding response OmpR family regulator
MTVRGRILLADDEETILQSTAALLRREGYECVTVSDGASALAAASAQPFDLLISDLEMPGNTDLALVRQIAEQVGGLPVIILTGFPSTRSAIACIELPVTAYLTKPVEFSELLVKVEQAVARFRSYQSVRSAEQHLEEWRRDLDAVPQAVPGTGPIPANTVDAFLTLTLRNVMGSLTDLQQLSRALAQQPVAGNPCQLINCPRGMQLHQAIRETIDVLESTKHAFKSKTLADLRHRLELLLAHN